MTDSTTTARGPELAEQLADLAEQFGRAEITSAELVPVLIGLSRAVAHVSFFVAANAPGPGRRTSNAIEGAGGALELAIDAALNGGPIR